MNKRQVLAAALAVMPITSAQAQTAPGSAAVDMKAMGGDAADRWLDLQRNYKRLDDQIEGPARLARSKPAKPKDVSQGREVRDAAGLVVGTITKVDNGFAVVSGLLGSVEVDVKSFAKNRHGLLINLAKSKIDTMMVRKMPVLSAGKPDAMRKTAKLIPLATVQDQNEVIVKGDGIIRVGINGKLAALRIDPAAPGIPLIRRQLAAKAGSKMKRGSPDDISYLVGRTLVPVRSQSVKVDFGRGVAKTRVGWSEVPFLDGADGSVGPGGFLEEIVRFVLRDAMPGEKTIALPMERDALSSGAAGQLSAIFGLIAVEGKPMRVCFDPHHARSLVTAGAGRRLARQNGGVISGDAVPTEIFFGVRRPVRTLTLQQPLQLGTLAIGSLGIRTSDRSSVASVPGESGDPEDIVVTAKGNKRDPRSDTLSLGSDYLSRCSSIVFDRKKRVIELTCA
ncbi:hypothetical protein [uncultured Sphingomonas sp.]|uniref:hypothetical protein n=1 Tax=uncultured Sphingomonas sp. TaxID=158754 RepID=UPI0035C9E1B0